MIELASQVAHFLHIALGCGVLGILTFALIVEAGAGGELAKWRERWVLSALAMTAAYLLAGGIIFAGQLRAVVGDGMTEPAAWNRYALGTHFGVTWLFQHGVATLLLLHLAARPCVVATLGWLPYLAVGAALALLAVPASAFAGHGAADDAAAVAIAINWTHIVAVSLWAGALPVPLASTLQAARDPANQAARRAGAVLRRFSGLAVVAMLCLVASGLATAWWQVRGLPPLLGTAYGQLLLLKLMLLAAILAVAAHLRWHLLPRIDEMLASVRGARRLSIWLATETSLAVAAIALASALSALPPARHDSIVWPLTLRFAPDIAWVQPGVPEQLATGIVVAVAGLPAAWWLHRRATAMGRYAVSAFLILIGLAIALSSLAVPANPDTYRRADVPYDVFSIANGERLFRQNCVVCHGVNATGDGEAAASTPRPPADLTAPHARAHTPGDIFWWVSRGIQTSGMPGFADILAEDERWDLVNFLHTLAAGYQARMIRESIAPRAPWLAAPDFTFVTASGVSVHLSDYRRRHEVLLVLYTLPNSTQRLDQLRGATDLFTAAGTAVLAVPIKSTAGEDEISPATALTPGTSSGESEQITKAYMLYRRTLANSRAGEVGERPRHIEFLIDRYGFIRARWVPEDGSAGWANIPEMFAQIRAIAVEGAVRDPPDGHLH